jgi:hypothetical protein
MSNRIKTLIFILSLIIIFEGYIIYHSSNIENQILLPSFSFNDSGNYIFAEGSWASDEKLAFPLQTTRIQCFQDLNFCITTFGRIAEKFLFLDSEVDKVETWNEKEIVLAPRKYACVREDVRIDRINKQVTMIRTKISETDICKAISSEPIHSYLTDGWKALEKAKK